MFTTVKLGAKFVAVGLINTMTTLLIIYIAIGIFKLPDVPANFLGYIVGLFISFTLNRTWTFENRAYSHQMVPRFIAVFAIAYIVNLIFLLTFIEVLDVDQFIAHLIAMPAYTIIFFFGCKHFVFPRNIPTIK